MQPSRKTNLCGSQHVVVYQYLEPHAIVLLDQWWCQMVRLHIARLFCGFFIRGDCHISRHFPIWVIVGPSMWFCGSRDTHYCFIGSIVVLCDFSVAILLEPDPSAPSIECTLIIIAIFGHSYYLVREADVHCWSALPLAHFWQAASDKICSSLSFKLRVLSYEPLVLTKESSLIRGSR